MAKYHISPDHVIRHCDVRVTACPGDRFPFTWLQASLQRQWIASGLQPGLGVDGTEAQRERQLDGVTAALKGGDHGPFAFASALFHLFALPVRR